MSSKKKQKELLANQVLPGGYSDCFSGFYDKSHSALEFTNLVNSKIFVRMKNLKIVKEIIN